METCANCGKPATHKIEDDGVWTEGFLCVTHANHASNCGAKVEVV